MSKLVEKLGITIFCLFLSIFLVSRIWEAIAFNKAVLQRIYNFGLDLISMV